MDKEKILKIVNSAENATNKDLITASNELKEEYEKTKVLIVDLTKHLETIENLFSKINDEYKKRFRE